MNAYEAWPPAKNRPKNVTSFLGKIPLKSGAPYSAKSWWEKSPKTCCFIIDDRLSIHMFPYYLAKNR